jgi:hypothetical protein
MEAHQDSTDAIANANLPRGSAARRERPATRPVLYDSAGKLLAYGRLSANRLGKQLNLKEARS